MSDIKIKQLSLEFIERILMEKEYTSKDEVMINALTKYKSLDDNNQLKKVLKQTISYLKDLSFEEMQELINLFKYNKF